jgi:hypothetical protein
MNRLYTDISRMQHELDEMLNAPAKVKRVAKRAAASKATVGKSKASVETVVVAKLQSPETPAASQPAAEVAFVAPVAAAAAESGAAGAADKRKKRAVRATSPAAAVRRKAASKRVL